MKSKKQQIRAKRQRIRAKEQRIRAKERRIQAKICDEGEEKISKGRTILESNRMNCLQQLQEREMGLLMMEEMAKDRLPNELKSQVIEAAFRLRCPVVQAYSERDIYAAVHRLLLGLSPNAAPALRPVALRAILEVSLISLRCSRHFTAARLGWTTSLTYPIRHLRFHFQVKTERRWFMCSAVCKVKADWAVIFQSVKQSLPQLRTMSLHIHSQMHAVYFDRLSRPVLDNSLGRWRTSPAILHTRSAILDLVGVMNAEPLVKTIEVSLKLEDEENMVKSCKSISAEGSPEDVLSELLSKLHDTTPISVRARLQPRK